MSERWQPSGFDFASIKIVDDFEGIEELNTARNELTEYGKGVTKDSPSFRALHDHYKFYELKETVEAGERSLRQEKSPEERDILLSDLIADKVTLRMFRRQIDDNRIPPGTDYAIASEEWESRIEKYKQVYTDRYDHAIKTNQRPRITTFYEFHAGPTTTVRGNLGDLLNEITSRKG